MGRVAAALKNLKLIVDNYKNQNNHISTFLESTILFILTKKHMSKHILAHEHRVTHQHRLTHNTVLEKQRPKPTRRWSPESSQTSGLYISYQPWPPWSSWPVGKCCQNRTLRSLQQWGHRLGTAHSLALKINASRMWLLLVGTGWFYLVLVGSTDLVLIDTSWYWH